MAPSTGRGMRTPGAWCSRCASPDEEQAGGVPQPASAVRAALDAVPDLVNGLLVYRGRGSPGLRVHQGGSGAARAAAVARPGRHRRGVARVSWPLLARPLAGALAGAGPAAGHGGSPPLPRYTFHTLRRRGRRPRRRRCPHRRAGTFAGRRRRPGPRRAAGSTAPVQAVIGLGIKVAWTEEDLDRAQAAAHRSPAWFASRDEAAARYLRMSGSGRPAGRRRPSRGSRPAGAARAMAAGHDPGAFAVGRPTTPGYHDSRPASSGS